jgi:hypothetical protein
MRVPTAVARSPHSSDHFLQRSLRQLLYILSPAPGDNEKHSGARAPVTHVVLPALQIPACAIIRGWRSLREKWIIPLCRSMRFWLRVFITRLPGFAHSTPGDESFKRIRVEQSQLLICTFGLHNILLETLFGWLDFNITNN